MMWNVVLRFVRSIGKVFRLNLNLGDVKFGRCKIDSGDCYAFGCICRLNLKAGFQSDYNYANPQKRYAFRNKECSNFVKRVV